jgi:hypothetical protein
LWSDGGNWSLLHVPKANEDAVFTTVTPGSGDNCLWTGGTAPAGLFMFSTYPGTVTFNAAMEIGTDGLDLEGGNISQPVAGANLTVDGLFTWVAGNLNDSPVQNVVLVRGGGNITGNAARTAGDTLSVTSVANFQMTADLTFNNNAGISVSSSGVWSWTGNGNLATAGSGSITNSGGLFQVNPGNQVTVNSELPISNSSSSGSVQVLTGTFSISDPQNMNTPGINQTYGSTIIYSGATLNLAAGFRMVGGYLYTVGRPIATINGDVTVVGGEIDLNYNNPNATGNLSINGNFSIGYSATYVAKIDVGNQFVDQISTTGNIYIATGATLTVRTINIPQGGVPAGITTAIMTTARGSTISGDFDYKNLDFNDGSGGAWNTEIEERPNNGGYNYLIYS